MKFDYDEMKGMLVHRDELIHELSKMAGEKLMLEEDLCKAVIENKMYDCMTLNYNKLRRHLNPIEREMRAKL